MVEIGDQSRYLFERHVHRLSDTRSANWGHTIIHAGRTLHLASFGVGYMVWKSDGGTKILTKCKPHILICGFTIIIKTAFCFRPIYPTGLASVSWGSEVDSMDLCLLIEYKMVRVRRRKYKEQSRILIHRKLLQISLLYALHGIKAIEIKSVILSNVCIPLHQPLRTCAEDLNLSH